MIWEVGGEICLLPASIETLVPYVVYTVRYCKLVLLCIVSWCCSVGILLSLKKMLPFRAQDLENLEVAL